MLSELFGILLYLYSECLKKHTGRSNHEVQFPDDSRGGELGAPGTYADSRLQIAPWRPEKIHGTWDNTYIRRYTLFFCISRKVCKCVEGWSVPLSILSQSHEESRSLKCCPLHLQIPETQVMCMPTYIGAIPWPVNFFASSGYNLEPRVSICTGNAQFTTPAAPGYYLAIVSHDGIPLYIF